MSNAIKLAIKARSAFLSGKRAGDDTITNYENTINTRFGYTELEAARKTGFLVKPEGSNRYYIALGDMRVQKKYAKPATQRPFTNLREMMA